MSDREFRPDFVILPAENDKTSQEAIDVCWQPRQQAAFIKGEVSNLKCTYERLENHCLNNPRDWQAMKALWELLDRVGNVSFKFEVAADNFDDASDEFHRKVLELAVVTYPCWCDDFPIQESAIVKILDHKGSVKICF